MSALILVAMLFAHAPSNDSSSDVSVVVLSRHRATDLTVDARDCTVDGKRTPIARLRATREAVKVCDASGTCLTHPRVHIACQSAIALTLPGETARTYGRSLDVKNDTGALRVIAHIDLESYTSGVVASELFATEDAALDAVSIVVRTYAAHARTRPRHDDAMLCDLTHCQVMKTTAREGAAVRATERTRDFVLKARDGSIAPVFHHAACGGHTVDARTLWPDRALRDVVGVPDLDPKGRAFCASSPHATWRSEVDDVAVARALSVELKRNIDAPSLVLTARDVDGIRFLIADVHGEAEISGVTLQRVLGRELGWSQVKSQRFVVERAGRKLRLRGSGFGHRVGLCQEGTRARARAGASASAILRAYFPRFTALPLVDDAPVRSP